ncbi:hypothetical protein AB1285_26395 [Microbacterium sp. NRRL B-14842]|uniref:hypothetical protein n=1 Tax=Microbacterium sp. NRRL B-14842 TaxID=3162881 RepID=UPI003D29DA24
MPAERRARTVSGTMAYESAADETVFVFGPFLVGVLASALAPWAPLVGAAALTLVFVGAFALHPSGRHVSQDRTDDGRAPSAVSDLFRPQLLIVVPRHPRRRDLLRHHAHHAHLVHGRPRSPGAGGAAVRRDGRRLRAAGPRVAWLPVRFSLRARWLVFSGILLAGSLLLGIVDSPAGMMLALAIMGIGIGPTLVTQYSFGAARSPRGRSATVMTMLGSGVIVGQSIGAAVAGRSLRASAPPLRSSSDDRGPASRSRRASGTGLSAVCTARRPLSSLREDRRSARILDRLKLLDRGVPL